MSAAEVIAEAVPHLDGCTDRPPEDDFFCWCKHYRREVGEAVLAAIRAMSPSEQAEVIGGEVEWGALGWGGGLIRWGMTAKTARRVIATLNRESADDAPDVKPTARAVGPWREVQP